ncbi:MAG: S8 family serine peptidase [Planctomycetota bacterium]
MSPLGFPNHANGTGSPSPRERAGALRSPRPARSIHLQLQPCAVVLPPAVLPVLTVLLLTVLLLTVLAAPIARAAEPTAPSGVEGVILDRGRSLTLVLDPTVVFVRVLPAADGRGSSDPLLELQRLTDDPLFEAPTPEDILEYPGLLRLRFHEETTVPARLLAFERLAGLPRTEWASGNFQDPARPWERAWMIPTPQIVVSLDESAANRRLAELLALTDLPGGARLTLDRALHGPRPTFVLHTGAAALDSFRVAEVVAGLPGVVAAQPEFIRRLESHGTPSDTLFLTQWNLQNTGQHGGTPGADIRAVPAWDIETGSSAITVAVIDEGVDHSHPDLAPQMVAGYDAVTVPTGGPGSSLPGQADPEDAHGTACAGIIGSNGNNGIGTAGVCWSVSILPIRIGFGEFWTQDSWIADGISAAVSLGADVLSNSWGGGSPTPIVDAAITAAVTSGRGGLGCPSVFSSGNADIGEIAYPASHDLTIAVGATSPCDERKSPTSCDGQWWWGSQFGPELDLVAPGPFVTTTDNSGGAGYAAGNFVEFSGTSAACPHVAGAAALALSLNPSLSAAELRDLLQSSARDEVGPPAEDIPGWDPYMGHGRLDLLQLLLSMGGGTLPPGDFSCTAEGEDALLEWTNPEVYDQLLITRNQVLIASLPGDATSYLDLAPGLGLQRYKVAGVTAAGTSPRTACASIVLGTPTDLVWSPAQGSVPGGAPIAEALVSLGRVPVLVSDLADAGALEAYETIWVNLGVFNTSGPSGKHVLTASEGQALDGYLAAGTPESPRFLYLEGADTWFFDPPTTLHSRFGIVSNCDGFPTPQLSMISGLPGPPPCSFDTLQYGYVGEDAFIDHLEVAPGSGAQRILENDPPIFGVAISRQSTGHATIGASWELAGVEPGGSDVRDFVAAALTCWGVSFDLDPHPTPVSINSCVAVSSTSQLNWNNGDLYDEIHVLRDGDLIAVLPGDAGVAIDPVAHSGVNVYEVIGIFSGLPAAPAVCSVDHSVPSNTIEVPQLLVEIGAAIDLPVLAHHSLPLEGFTISVVYDPGVLDLTQATMAGTELEAAGAGYFAPQIDPVNGVITIAAVIDPVPPVTGSIPPGDDHVIVRLLGQLAPSATVGASTSVEIPQSVGSPAVTSIFLQGGMVGHEPQRVSGSVTVVENLDLRLEVAGDTSQPGGGASTPVLLTTDRPLVAYSFGLPWSADQLAPTGATLVGTVGESAAFALVTIDPVAEAITASVIIDTSEPYDLVIPPGADYLALQVEWLVDALLPAPAEIVIPVASGLGSPPVAVAFTGANNQNVVPLTLAGTILVLPNQRFFLRGDANDDGTITLADPIALLSHLFQGVLIPCEDAGDANDDGMVDISDAVFVLQHLFTGGPPPELPWPVAGSDPTADTLGCS